MTDGTSPVQGVWYQGAVSEFGGSNDPYMGQTEGLALYEESDAQKRPDLFIPRDGVASAWGLAWRLNASALYCAMRWNYLATPKWVLRNSLVRIESLGDVKRFVLASPVDWGPRADLKRLIDVSPGVMKALGLETNKSIVRVKLLFQHESKA